MFSVQILVESLHIISFTVRSSSAQAINIELIELLGASKQYQKTKVICIRTNYTYFVYKQD